MTLPKYYETESTYFKDCTNFLRKYKFLYNFANTELLLHDVLDKIDIGLDYVPVFEEGFDLREIKNDFLGAFFEELDKFKIEYEDFNDENLEEVVDVPISRKKRHEIVYLAKEIKLQYGGQCDLVVDFGSGLGYLDQYIYETTQYKVLGLECSESNYIGAKKRQRLYHKNSRDQVKYIRHTINNESNNKIEEFLKDKFPSCDSFGIIGLHACADLTIDAMELFLKMDAAKHLIIMPCCYHKMKQNDGMFHNFPLSRKLKDIFQDMKGAEYLKVPFLRLGAQPPEVTDVLENSVFNLMARAVLELYARQHNYKLKRNKRKAVRTKTTNNDFENYLQNACIGFDLIEQVSGEGNKVQIDLDELRTIWRQINTVTLKKAGVFILLQKYLQPVVENYILFDKIVYLEENGVDCYFKKIFNEKLSPRCLVLIANK